MVEVFSTARKTGVSLVEQAYAEAWRRFNILRRLGPAGLVSYLERWVIALGMDILTSLGRVLTYRP
jgi:hypothetical protein